MSAPQRGELWRWKHDHNHELIYLRRFNGWNQFALKNEPTKVWCEVLDQDLNLMEKMPAPRTAELILLRGLPGSGKSTFARFLVNSSRGEIKHYEADMYFMGSGTYVFKPEQLNDAHQWCLRSTSNMLEANISVVVSNTFTRMMELQPYLNLAKGYGVKVTVLHVEGNHGSVHGVPESTMQRMQSRWEAYK